MTTASISRPHWTRWLLRRWPTALALAFGALAVYDMNNDSVGIFGEIVFLLTLEYLVIAKLGRRRASWPVVITLVAVVTVTQILDLSTSTALVALSAAVLVWGAVQGQLHRPGWFRVQALGAIGFAALAVTGLALDPEIGRYVVAAAWLFHGVWDIVHHRLDKVVSRSYAEACAVLDIVVAAGLIFLL